MIEPEILILPDIHGRDFYKEAVQEAISMDIEIVCLGDYLDPYRGDSLHEGGVMEPLKELMAVKNSRPEKTHLLLGNHDCSYFHDPYMCRVRFDIDNAPLYQEFFFKNASQFSLFHDMTIGSRRFLFSHAGITRRWLSETGNDSIDGLLEWLQRGFKEYCDDRTKDSLWNMLSHVGEERGGWDKSGSLIWADVREYLDMFNDLEEANLTQIVGHTQLVSHPVRIGSRLYCLDCREPFYIDSSGIIRSWKTNESIMDKYDIQKQ